MKRSVTTTSVAAAAMAVLITTGLSACKGSANNTSSSNGSSGGTVTIQGDSGNPTLVENFNPFASSSELHGAFLIYEPLEISSPVDGSYTPFLATGYRFSDPTTLTYTIRQGVKWSDGTPFTPADVVFTFNLLKKYPALDGQGVWQKISGVSSSGNDVTFKFTTPNVPFAATIAQTPIVPQHIWSSIADPTKYANTTPVGTGPFELSSFAPTQYALKKNPTYWQASKVAPSQVLFPAEASNQSSNQLDVTSGKFDWAYTFLPDVKGTYVARDPQHNTYWFPPGGTIGLYLNLTKAPYNDPNFRKGISLALDRHTIATKAVNGYLDQASQSGIILPNLKNWLDPSLPNQGVVTQNLSAAKAAFAQAGYTVQGGRLVGRNGQASMTIVLPNSFSDWVAAATEVSTELNAVGIKVTLDEPQYAQYSQATQSGTFDAAIGGFAGTGNPYSDFSTALYSGYAAPINTSSANNFERFKDPAVDQALTAMASATDMSGQTKAADQIEQIMYNQVPVVLMYYGGSWGLFSTKNFTGWPSASNPYTLPTNYNYSLLTVLTRISKA
ncbi:MAG TPA: ABC transporter substrate-binding protein [Acidimicrobiales bacterium]|jgi:peptide/nickel transport system substrate-binding protein|nr:ABC transporter substrate-binding protein [Acidimicrobiales bacterium]